MLLQLMDVLRADGMIDIRTEEQALRVIVRAA
ncbi:hypothetical protein PC116_g27096 [Phytophthora cactorum]|uniref:Uncharacterized protein n=1 Tax=Phytophthora cactorum TaxID=29920 RepID=A0A8T1AR36_9STRA|nr:hypothetical protein PC114_g25456 [Phytophthora cactorum]KAG2887130.1 hypothetical protein PC117_g25238 [Phytophthora cactorum]KAG2965169.1 hypothetical protein PC119_g25053 [Phytophthora cactorum]KAG2980970.1 hypothetical protein PC120_g24865 [Phytophthora cactorum]KAG3126041.1 hypothetical protein C6341_g25528 [Phytophthora cactorum]